MAFGVKVIDMKFKNAYSVEELFEIIKDKPFTAGAPSLVRDGLVKVIAFPELDRQNQINITQVGLKKQTKRYTVAKAEKAGFGNSVLNDIIDDVTDGWFGVGAVLGNNVKRCEELVEITAQELRELDL